MNLRPLLVVSSVLFLAVACAPRRIPGTDIPDTDDTRAILNVMEHYRAALEARDAKAIQALVAKNFRETGGTDDPTDDLTYENLPERLQHVFQRVEKPHVELSVRRINIDYDTNTAAAIYYWNANWRMPALNPRPQSDSELEQMVLHKEDGQWRIVSGI